MRIFKLKHLFTLSVSLVALSALSGCADSNPAPEDLASSATQAGSERDLAAEEANRRLVIDFYDRLFNDHATEAAAEVVADNYIQHNPDVPDGKDPFVSYFTGFFKDNPESSAKIVRSSTDGDLVWLHVHSIDSPGQRGSAIVDIFRVEDGLITEHWDVIQEVPEESANSNTMF